MTNQDIWIQHAAINSSNAKFRHKDSVGGNRVILPDFMQTKNLYHLPMPQPLPAENIEPRKINEK